MKVISQNRKARHEYFIIESYECGIVLTGTEIKSVRAGRVNFKDSYASIEKGELWLFNMHIAPYENGSYYNHKPERDRKLLMSKREIIRLNSKTREKGLTIVPLSIYLKNNRWAKIEIALARGKTAHDKREDIAERDAKLNISRSLRDKGRNYED
ncbi:MAG: SsrA-binding protein SmpB [Synergistaceae bacterium]|nr:SsrA-binding protein SmpB [Synergistaceae bacterium]